MLAIQTLRVGVGIAHEEYGKAGLGRHFVEQGGEPRAAAEVRDRTVELEIGVADRGIGPTVDGAAESDESGFERLQGISWRNRLERRELDQTPGRKHVLDAIRLQFGDEGATMHAVGYQTVTVERLDRATNSVPGDAESFRERRLSQMRARRQPAVEDGIAQGLGHLLARTLPLQVDRPQELTLLTPGQSGGDSMCLRTLPFLD